MSTGNAATCRQSLLRQLGIHARGLGTQPVSLSQGKRELLQSMQMSLMPNKQTRYQKWLYVTITVLCLRFQFTPSQPIEKKRTRYSRTLRNARRHRLLQLDVNSVTSFISFCVSLSAFFVALAQFLCQTFCACRRMRPCPICP